MTSVPHTSKVDLETPTLVADAFHALHADPEFDTAWGESLLHSSDLSKCARAVHARRNGYPMVGMPAFTHRKMRIGVNMEDHVAEALEFHCANTNVKFVRQREYIGIDGVGEMVGHPDFVLNDGQYDIPLELKSMVFTFRWVDGEKAYQRPKEPRRRDVIQLMTNALQMKAPYGRLYYVCRDSGLDQEWVLQTNDYEGRVRKLFNLYSTITAVGAPEPISEKPSSDIASWACKTCSNISCESNVNPMNTVF